MKTLTLTRETLAALTDTDLLNVQGAAGITVGTCNKVCDAIRDLTPRCTTPTI